MTRSAVQTVLMGSVIAALALSTSAQAALFSSVLPASRSVQVGEPASFFATMINASNLSAEGCRVELTSGIGATFTYQRTNAANEPVGNEGVPFSIAANENQSLVLSLTANSVVDPTDVEFTFSCDNNDPAPVYPGLNTLLFSASDQPTPDMVALSATLSGDGISVVPPNNQLGLFSIASSNLGSAATLTVRARATGVQPSVLVVCETDPQSGACLNSPTASAVSTVAANATPTYAVFFTDAVAKIPFDPAGNRIQLEFLDNGQIKGATSVAVRSSTATDLFVSEVSPDLVQPICLGCHFTGGDAGDTRLVFEANPNAEPPLLAANEQVFRTYIETVNDGVQVILSNVVGERGHSTILSAESENYANLSTFLNLLTLVADDFSVGLENRPSNTTCIAPTRSFSEVAYSLADAFPDLPNLPGPMKMIQPRSQSDTWYVLGREGGIEQFANTAGASSYQRYLNIAVTAAGEGGLLSAVFHPDWPAKKELFVSYTINSSGFESRLSRLVILDDATLPASYREEILLRVDQPQQNHNGGEVVIGNDGYLYWGIGDGGGAGDQLNNAQTTSNLLGNVLRIDAIDVAFEDPGYLIPPGNPFAGSNKCGPGSNGNNCPEIFAYGLRNPWRMSVDPSTGLLWTGDVGQGAWEEIDIVPEGGNMGWRCREGAHDFNTSGCPSSGFVEPVYEYPHTSGNGSITGGYVYRGNDIPELVGQYVYADYLTGRVWALETDGSFSSQLLLDASFRIASFSEGNDGEIFVVGLTTGRLYRLLSSGGLDDDNVPALLADTGCVSPVDPRQPAPGLIPYAPNAPFWSDGSLKARWLALPDGQTITVMPDSDWMFPTGTVIMKNFERNDRLIETRLFMRHPDGEWAGYSYEWNALQDAATRNDVSRVTNIDGQDWAFPGQGECLSCHTEAAGFTLGLETAQLNGPILYPSTLVEDNQLEVYNHIDLFESEVPEPVQLLPALADPADTAADLTDRSRAYLHTNCAACHQPDGGTGTDLDLRYSTALSETGACDVVPQAGDLGISNARVIAPGDADRSVLIARTNRRDEEAMPPLGSLQVDQGGVQLLTSWVNQLTDCL